METQMLKIKITNLGKDRINKVIEVDITHGMPNNSVVDLFIGIAKEYLLSAEIGAVLKNDYTCDIVVGYGRKVGEISIVK